MTSLLTLMPTRAGGVGFLNDVRRMNVALTRAKHSLLVIGNSSALVSSPPWRAFLSRCGAVVVLLLMLLLLMLMLLCGLTCVACLMLLWEVC